MKQIFYFIALLFVFGCKSEKKETKPPQYNAEADPIEYAQGFTLKKTTDGVTIIELTSPWPNAEASFTYALVPKEKAGTINLNKTDFDAIIPVPIQTVVVTSTTHIPALEALNELDKLTGFPDTQYISSKEARKRIESGQIIELGNNETINTEMVISLRPDLVVGFGINAQNRAYENIERSNIPVVYNGDWTEETPLGKAEWIKFFAPFFNKEKEAAQIFSDIEKGYLSAKQIAKSASHSPTVLSGAMYKDVWYLPGGNSWAAQFINDANADYLWKETTETGSLSLSWEHVLQKAKNAEYWISPAQFVGYEDMSSSSEHYKQFDAFQNKKIYTFSSTVGETGGLLYYELAPQRPDLVLKDLIHILHPGLLPKHEPFFFKPLK
ncbi:ABC transporter substrate-binding protein [Maribacter sp. MMG018]|uniref:ABC transporter substrate-binding protein n=1 Tax=Maribacter sp. MMG018 TaxID=2822688 RepID=UPI001B37D976|nr:ABC transporter substrate-binding protein [Maribacter sp. MMG018]MBQ4914836.1 ABC transporter substrate-binding protein [Maribacter sp. MMG018]